MAACGSKSRSVKSCSKNISSCDQSRQVKVQEWKACNVVSFSVLQKEQSELSANLNA